MSDEPPANDNASSTREGGFYSRDSPPSSGSTADTWAGESREDFERRIEAENAATGYQEGETLIDRLQRESLGHLDDCMAARTAMKLYADVYSQAVTAIHEGIPLRKSRLADVWTEQARFIAANWSECFAAPGDLQLAIEDAGEVLDSALGAFSRDASMAIHRELTAAIESPTSPATDSAADPEADESRTLEVFNDGSIRFLPPYLKDAAGYVEPDHSDFDSSHNRCATCVHYIRGEGCHFVRGHINPGAYCEAFYADYGVFAHDRDDQVVVNAELVSPEWDLDQREIEDFLSDIGERLQQHRRERTK